ncbi:MAG TPA: succinate dehydrogenase, cytochrome b556 subunit [Casimicrobiaceae bacterium]|nr:succinate dehydrogenase, cytochrome b556 subunit [Casimicrobiaceae bacterium]
MAAVDRPVARARPVYLNLLAIRQPLPAIVSILHRISGAGLFLVGIPLVLWALEASLQSPAGFAGLAEWFDRPLVKILTILVAWGYLYHLLAGLRHLMLDLHVGLDLTSARRSAALVLVISIVLAFAIAARLW